MELSDEKDEDLSPLLKELQENRLSLHGMLSELSKFRVHIDKLLPEKVDYRNRYVLAERMKTVVQIIQSELAVRKQIDDSIKSEVDLKKKVEGEGEGLGGLSLADRVKVLSKAIEK
jgi:hypothetical protein